MSPPKICETGGGGLILPLFGDSEHDWPDGVRVVLYGLVMLYFFYGASMVSDYFMSAIETITSKKKVITDPETGRRSTVDVWNPTVANLSLMALGSSAPEIMLSVVETMSNNFYSGELGPSTIVGSAAFNFFVIISVCIISIPDGESRKIKELDVYHITQVFSFLAYSWLLVIVNGSSPEVIEVWEALVTLAIFPVLLALSYCADRKWFNKVKEQSAASNRAPPAMNPRMRSVHAHQQKTMHKAADHHEEKVAKRRSTCGRQSKICVQGSPGSIDTAENLSKWIAYDAKGCPVDHPPGILVFEADVIDLKVNSDEEINQEILVMRKAGAEGSISCSYHTEKLSALPGYDYHEAEGVLEFGPGDRTKSIGLGIISKQQGDCNDFFQVVLDAPQGGVRFDPCSDGGDDSDLLTVNLLNANGAGGQGCFQKVCCEKDVLNFGIDFWKEQILEAIDVRGGEEDKAVGVLDYIAHGIALPWKVFFSVTTPPPIYCGGWLLFVVALSHIALVTTVVCDLASLFGCVLGIEDTVTAIIIVAPGTSLPDLFASKSAATSDPFADASIVNVTGSNSVNVFLGIGIPWTMSAIYWATSGATDEWTAKYPDMIGNYPNGGFVVKAGTLLYSVIVFQAAALCATVVLRIRRKLTGGELGGPANLKYASMGLLLFLYVFYTVGSILKAGGSDGADVIMYFLLVLAAIFVLIGVVFEFSAKQVQDDEEALLQKSDAPEPAVDISQEAMVFEQPAKLVDTLDEEASTQYAESVPPVGDSSDKLLAVPIGKPDVELTIDVEAAAAVPEVDDASTSSATPSPAKSGTPNGKTKKRRSTVEETDEIKVMSSGKAVTSPQGSEATTSRGGGVEAKKGKAKTKAKAK